MFQSILAYIFSTLILFGSMGVVIPRNPVHNVLFLIFSFLNSSALYILLGAEFLALSTVIVYIGAVAVLLLFVVMTMSNTTEKGFIVDYVKPYRSWILGIMVVFIVEMMLVSHSTHLVTPDQSQPSNIKAIGRVLYTDYGLVFQACAVLLLVAMVSAVIITFQSRTPKNIKRQNATDQINRNPDHILKKVKIKSREGI